MHDTALRSPSTVPLFKDINLTMYKAAIDSTDDLKNPESEDKARKEAEKLFASLAQYGTDDHSFSKDIFLS